MAHCPECDAEIQVPEGTRAGEVLGCPECQAQLEVICLEPLELAVAPEVEEDWGE
jgi:alpha-aminoadipate carrier protein LysW